MRFLILLFFSFITLSASAQWWQLDFKKHERFPLLTPLKDHSVNNILTADKLSRPRLYARTLSRSQYSLEVAEASVIKIVQHNMRFRIYSVASYNFSELADLYVQQNRLSEAKWYLLQSNLISRQQNDDKHTISNLIGLALIKAEIGDFVLAQDDLMEARDIASAKGRFIDLIEIEKKLSFIQRNRFSSIKTDLRYADTAELENKANL